ncbi:MAG: hypothetical protein V4629_10345 [Pseudomonadota bacterium]
MKLAHLMSYATLASKGHENISPITCWFPMRVKPFPRRDLTALCMTHPPSVIDRFALSSRSSKTVPLTLTHGKDLPSTGFETAGNQTMSDEEARSAMHHPIFITPEAYHEANQIYLKSQECYPFRFSIINPNHLRANETFIDTFSRYKIYVVHAQHNETQEIVPHVVTYVKQWKESIINQLIIPIPALPWVIDSLKEVFQSELHMENLPKKELYFSKEFYDDLVGVEMDIDYHLQDPGEERSIIISSFRHRTNGRYSTKVQGTEFSMAYDLKILLRKIYYKYAPPEEALAYYNRDLD